MVPADQLRDCATHRIADDERGGQVKGAQHLGRIARRSRPAGTAPAVAVPVRVRDGRWPARGSRLQPTAVYAAPVQVGGGHPAMEEHHRWAVTARVPEEELPATPRTVRAGRHVERGSGGQGGGIRACYPGYGARRSGCLVGSRGGCHTPAMGRTGVCRRCAEARISGGMSDA